VSAVQLHVVVRVRVVYAKIVSCLLEKEPPHVVSELHYLRGGVFDTLTVTETQMSLPKIL
jgi:hypothetical protein